MINENSKKKSTFRTVVFVAFAVVTVIWMSAIFGFSANDAQESTQQSHSVTKFVLSILMPDFNEMDEASRNDLISEYDGIVRKAAHFAAYAILGFLAYFAAGSFKNLPYILYSHAVISVPVCVVFALSDEYHQTLVDGRAGRMSDVLIDTSGVLFGTAVAIAVAAAILRILKRKLHNN